MAWIELHQSLPGHRKTMRLRRALKIGQAQAIGHLCMLWLWCLDNCPDGDLSSLLDCEIAEAAGYDKKPTDFTAALRESGFLDENNHIHDWYSYAGKLIEKRREDAERKRTSRTQKASRGADVQRTSIGHPSDVQRMSSVTVPNTTVPNRTQPKDSSCGGNAREDWNPFGDAPEIPPDTLESYLASNLPPLTRGNIEELTAFQEAGMQPDAIRFAVDQAAAQGKRNWAYVRGILRRMEQAGIFTAGAAKAAEDARKEQYGTDHRQNPADTARRHEGAAGSAGDRYKPDPAEVERIARERGIL